MGCNKAMLLTANTATTTLAAAGVIPLGSAVHGIGTAVRLNGNAISLLAPGYYYIDVSATITAAAATEIGVQMTSNGVPIPGAEASMVHAADAEASVSFPWVIRKGCCGDATQIGFILSEAGTVENFVVRVVKA